jgi:hypothetical protein
VADTTIKSVEAKVLDSLSDATEPLDLDKLIERVRQSDHDTRSVDVKIAALSLVSKGQIGLNEFWQLSTP